MADTAENTHGFRSQHYQQAKNMLRVQSTRPLVLSPASVQVEAYRRFNLPTVTTHRDLYRTTERVTQMARTNCSNVYYKQMHQEGKVKEVLYIVMGTHPGVCAVCMRRHMVARRPTM